MKSSAATLLIWVFLLLVTAASVRGYISQQKETKRLTRNLEAVTAEADSFRTRDGHTASRIAAQEITISELKNAFSDVAGQLHNLKIRPAQAVSYTQTASRLNVDARAPVKDSVINRLESNRSDTIFIPDTVRTLKYSDAWLSVTAILPPPPQLGTVKVSAIDSIFTVINWDRRWFLGAKHYEVNATNRNPYIKIEVIQGGIIKKKKQ